MVNFMIIECKDTKNTGKYQIFAVLRSPLVVKMIDNLIE